MNQSSGRLSVRIERQNSRGIYVWMAILGTAMFLAFCELPIHAYRLHPQAVLYIAPIIVLAVTCYLIAIAIALWGAFGVEEVDIEGDVLHWRRSALRWERTRTIPLAAITEIKAITPWHGLGNSVELIAAGKVRNIGKKLLRDEAIELAQHLKHASHLHSPPKLNSPIRDPKV